MLRGRNFNAPRSRNHRACVRLQKLFKILTPERLPHLSQVGIGRQWTTFRRIERPVLARTPRATKLVTRRPELPAWSTTRNHFTFPWQQRVNSQTPTAVFV